MNKNNVNLTKNNENYNKNNKNEQIEDKNLDNEILLELIENKSIDDEILYFKSNIQIIESNTNEQINEQIEQINEIEEIEQQIDNLEENDIEMDVDMEVEDVEDEDLDVDKICWSNKIDNEPCCISVHPKFPNIPQVAIGTCGDNCHIYDFNNNTTNNGLKYILGPFEETVSCCSFSSCGNFLALGCLNSTLLLYSVTVTGPSDSNGPEGSNKDTTNTTTNSTTNKDIKDIKDITMDTTSTTGKGANSTLMECTMGKGANSMPMECTSSNNKDTEGVTTNKGAPYGAVGGVNTKGVGDGSTVAVGASTVTEEYKLIKKFDTMLLTIEWLNINNKILCCSGEGGLLFIYNFIYNNIQFINIFHNSIIGFVFFPVTVLGHTATTSTTNTSNTHTNTTLGTIGPSTVTEENSNTRFAAPGKGANSTATECTTEVTPFGVGGEEVGCHGTDPVTGEEIYIILNSNNKLLIINYNIITNNNNIIIVNNNKLDNENMKEKTENNMEGSEETSLGGAVGTVGASTVMEDPVTEEIITIEMNIYNKICIYGTMNGIIRFINMKGIILSSNNIHKDSIESIIYNKNTNIYISGDLKGLILFYNNNFNIINKIDIKIGITRILELNNYYIISTIDGYIFLIKFNQIINKYKLHTKPIINLQLLNQYIITISQDNTIKM